MIFSSTPFIFTTKGFQLAKEVLEDHFKRQEAILRETIEEDRALSARIRATGPVNSYNGFDASHDANVARMEVHEAKKARKRQEEKDRQQRLRHERAKRDVEDKVCAISLNVCTVTKVTLITHVHRQHTRNA